ncbi:MAG: ABC transporter permease, partial [Promethearchaeota archaeon]
HTIAAIPRSLVVMIITIPILLLGTGTLPVGNVFVLGLILLLTLLALVPVGELIGIRTKQKEQAILFSVLFAVFGFLAGGGLAPIGLMPAELRVLAMLLPTTHSIGMWTRVFFLDTISGLLPGFVALLSVWIVLSMVAAQLMKREVERS